MSEENPNVEPETTETGEAAPQEQVEISQEAQDILNAEEAHFTQSSVMHVTATKVEMRQSGAQEIHGDQVNVHQSGVLSIQAEHLTLEQGSAFMACATEATFQNSSTVVAILDSGTLQDSTAGVVIARQVLQGPVHTTVLLAGQVEGPVETLLDTPRALLAGLASGVAVGLVLLLGKLFTWRRR